MRMQNAVGPLWIHEAFLALIRLRHWHRESSRGESNRWPPPLPSVSWGEVYAPGLLAALPDNSIAGLDAIGTEDHICSCFCSLRSPACLPFFIFVSASDFRAKPIRRFNPYNVPSNCLYPFSLQCLYFSANMQRRLVSCWTLIRLIRPLIKLYISPCEIGSSRTKREHYSFQLLALTPHLQPLFHSSFSVSEVSHLHNQNTSDHSISFGVWIHSIQDSSYDIFTVECNSKYHRFDRRYSALALVWFCLRILYCFKTTRVNNDYPYALLYSGIIPYASWY